MKGRSKTSKNLWTRAARRTHGGLPTRLRAPGHAGPTHTRASAPRPYGSPDANAIILYKRRTTWKDSPQEKKMTVAPHPNQTYRGRVPAGLSTQQVL